MRKAFGFGETRARSAQPPWCAPRRAPGTGAALRRGDPTRIVILSRKPSARRRTSLSFRFPAARHSPGGGRSPLANYELALSGAEGSLATEFLIDILPIRTTAKLFPSSIGAHSNRHSSATLFRANSARVGNRSAAFIFAPRPLQNQRAENSCYNNRWSWSATQVTLRKPIEPTLDPRVPASPCPCARLRRILGWGKPESRRRVPDLTRGVQGLVAHGEVDRSSKFSSPRFAPACGAREPLKLPLARKALS